MKQLFIACLTALITACTISANPVLPEISVEQSQMDAKNTKACALLGGVYRPVCLTGAKMCVVTYEDAGKACHSSSDCEGVCVNTGPHKDIGESLKGHCSVNSDPCGCMQKVEDGKAEPGICID